MSELASAGQLRMSFLRMVLVTVPLILFLGIVSVVLAGPGAGNAWYAMLQRPSFAPSGGVFAIIWIILYVLIGLAFSLILFARGASGRGVAIGLFVAQLVPALAWLPIFFARHAVGLAFATILLAIVLALASTLAFARIRHRAALLMLPYLLWLCFAAWFNHAIEVLNPDAATLAPGRASAQVSF